MKRSQGSAVVMSLITGLIVAAVGCGDSSRQPIPTAPSGPAYMISGVTTGYHGGPVNGATVTASPHLPNLADIRPSTTQTDQQGRYRLSTSGTVALSFWKEGFTAAYKNNVSAPDQTVDIVLHSAIVVGPIVGRFVDEWRGDTVTGTIRGDEFMAGDDVLFGGLCAQAACKVVEPGGGWPPNNFEVRLHWTDPTRQLALYVSRDVNLESVPFRSSAPDRYCCSADLVATVDRREYFGPYIAIAFEQAAGGPPSPSDSQPFELTVQPVR